MKVRILLKDPDGVYDSITEAVDQIEFEEGFDELDEDERETLKEVLKEKIEESCSKFIKYSEYVEIEIDTEKQTAIVIPVT